MLNRLKDMAGRYVYAKEGEDFCRYFRVVNACYWRIPVTVGWDAGRQKYYVCDAASSGPEQQRIYVANPRRVHNFFRGLAQRMRILEKQYFLNQIPVQPGDTVIDCGANIGELGLYFTARNVPVRYIAIEPEPGEGDCLLLNNANDRTTLIRKALWKEETTLTFYSKPDTADSSVFEIDEFAGSHAVEATTLTSIADAQQLGGIKLLKLEAEGAEPEVLEGIGERLRDIAYITADCGEERGTAKEHTVAQVSNRLISDGFEMVDMSFDRIVCLFRNTRYQHHQVPVDTAA